MNPITLYKKLKEIFPHSDMRVICDLKYEKEGTHQFCIGASGVEFDVVRDSAVAALKTSAKDCFPADHNEFILTF